MSTLYQHFRPDEKEFIDQVLGWRQFVEDTFSPKLTDFLDPRQIHIVKSIIGKHSNVKIEEFGGYHVAERKRVLLYPEYFSPETEEFQISLFEIEYPSKFVNIGHRQVLGTLMSLGLKREKFGDILINHDRIQLFLTDEMSSYVKLELKQIGKTSIKLTQKSFDQTIISDEVWQELLITVSSLRLDAVLSNIYPISRQKAQTLIQHGLVKVNWKETEQTAFVCEVGDVISARGFGRSKIVSIEGQTKKEKWRLMVGVLK
jgi:RNA-binding protein YlmH